MNFIDKYKLHIFDRRFTIPGCLACFPVVYVERMLLYTKINNTLFWVIIYATVVIVSSGVAQILGSWWYKRQVNRLKSQGKL